MIRRGASAYDADGRGGPVLASWEGADMDTGELLQRATVLTFGPPTGRDAVRVPEVVNITVDRTLPPQPRHVEARHLCGWLAACKRTVDPKQADMLRVLHELVTM